MTLLADMKLMLVLAIVLFSSLKVTKDKTICVKHDTLFINRDFTSQLFSNNRKIKLVFGEVSVSLEHFKTKTMMALLADIKLMLVLAIVIVYHLKTTTSIEKCNPIERCSHRSGIRVPNPLDGDSYFLCVKDANGDIMPSDAPMKCPSNTSFSDSYHNCHQYGKTLCINACNGECTKYYHEKIANIKDCSSFYTCMPGNKKVETRCPPDNPYFDGNMCQKSKYLCCTCCDECTVYCHTRYIQIADPFDCKSFYICHRRGLPEPENRYQCEEGDYFNRFKGRCEVEDKNNPCVPSCKNKTISN